MALPGPSSHTAGKGGFNANIDIERLGLTSQLGGLRGLQVGGGAEVTGFSMVAEAPAPELRTRRGYVIRPFRPDDFAEVGRVLTVNVERLAPVGLAPDDTAFLHDLDAFTEWVDQLDLLRALDLRYEFGAFDGDELIGGSGLWGVVRGPAQSAFASGWIAAVRASENLGPEGFVAQCKFAFDDLGLHRFEAPVLPDNQPSIAVFERLGLRNKGVTEKYLMVNGEWRDHVRFVMTAEDWTERRDALLGEWGEQQ